MSLTKQFPNRVQGRDAIHAGNPESCVAMDLPSNTKPKNDPDSAVCFESLPEPNDAYSKLRRRLRIAPRTDVSNSADVDRLDAIPIQIAGTRSRARRAVISDGAGGFLIVLLGLVLLFISRTSDNVLILTSAWANLTVGAAIGIACLFSKTQRPMGAIALLLCAIGILVLDNVARQ